MLERKLSPIITQIIANLIPLYGVLFLDWRPLRLLVFYSIEGFVLIFYGVLRILAAPHKEEEDLIIPINEDIDYRAIPRSFEKGTLIILFVIYSLIFTFSYILLSLIIWGIAEIPLNSINQLGLSIGQLVVPLAAFLISHGLSYFEDFGGERAIEQDGDKRQVNIGLYRIVFKLIIVFMFAAFIQIFSISFRDQYLTVLAKSLFDTVLILRIRNI